MGVVRRSDNQQPHHPPTTNTRYRCCGGTWCRANFNIKRLSLGSVGLTAATVSAPSTLDQHAQRFADAGARPRRGARRAVAARAGRAQLRDVTRQLGPARPAKSEWQQ